MEQSMNINNNMTEPIYNLLPPTPPVIEETIITSELPISSIEDNEESFIAGEFLYISNLHSRLIIQNGWRAVQLTETADFVKQDIESFQMSDDPRIWIISNKMDEIENPPGHSGFTFGWTMRQLQLIYKHGENEYRKSWVKNS